ncbi:unnamed protein product, partial [Mesorhabditis spiculigera]
MLKIIAAISLIGAIACAKIGINDIDVGACEAGISMNQMCPGDLLVKGDFCYEPKCVEAEINKRAGRVDEELKKKKEKQQKEEEDRKQQEKEAEAERKRKQKPEEEEINPKTPVKKEEEEKPKVKPRCGRESNMCRHWVKQGFCKNAAYAESIRVQHCGRTCGLCQ